MTAEHGPHHPPASARRRQTPCRNPFPVPPTDPPTRRPILLPPLPAPRSRPPPCRCRPGRQCLRWAAIGKTSWETSRILGLSESTVNFHLRNACERLGVRGRRAAVAKALQEKLLDAFTASS